MKTNLPLPNKEKTLPWNIDLCHRLGVPFASARQWKISFSESDIKYIETVIKTHKLYRVIYKQGQLISNKDNFDTQRRLKTELEFLVNFINDPKCPKFVSNFIYLYVGNLRVYLYVGNLRAMLQENGCTKQQFALDQFFIERWMETCR